MATLQLWRSIRGHFEVRRSVSCDHTARFSSSLICDQQAISSIERKQPSHKPLPVSILQTEMHGDGTVESCCSAGIAFKDGTSLRLQPLIETRRVDDDALVRTLGNQIMAVMSMRAKYDFAAVDT